eukprot:5497805-Pyramimonas_sp.AAC.1
MDGAGELSRDPMTRVEEIKAAMHLSARRVKAELEERGASTPPRVSCLVVRCHARRDEPGP